MTTPQPVQSEQPVRARFEPPVGDESGPFWKATREGRLLVDGLSAQLEALARSGRRIAEAVGISTNLAATRNGAGDDRRGRAADVR